MARSFSVKKRNLRNRKRKPVILIIAEGHNVTETQYFKGFQQQYSAYSIKLLIQGHITDPPGMLKALERYWSDYDMSEEEGNMAFVVLDLDCDNEKAKMIRELGRKSKVAKFIVSNSCFEVWFLLHYEYTTHSFLSSAEVIKRLKVRIPTYEKNIQMHPLLSSSTEEAIKNAEKLVEHYHSLKAQWPSNDCNPRTDVFEIVDLLKKKE